MKLTWPLPWSPIQVLWFVTGVILLVFLYIWSVYNAIIRKRNQVKTDYSDIDIQVKRRASLIQNLADLVHDYAKHEKETFENVASARSAVNTSKTPGDQAKASNMLTETLRSLFMVVEQYPKLQASENFKQLRDDLNQTENLIASSRADYNLSVQDYNTYIQSFPSLLIANLLHFQEEELYQTSEQSI